MSKVALVLGTNAGQADLIRHLKDDAWIVHACAHRAGGAGEALADTFHLLDISKPAEVTALAKNVKAEVVYSCSSDIAVPAVIAASDALGLPHFFDEELIDLFNQKTKLRAWLNAQGLSPVPFIRLSDASEAAGWSIFPCIVKPSDSQGQRGVAKIEQVQDLAGAVERAISLSPTGSAIIEAYLNGVEVSTNVLVSGGKVVVAELSERLVHGDHLIGVPSGHLIPTANVSQANIDATDRLVRDVVQRLGIVNGCLYFQMKVTDQGPRIVEIAPRIDGCHIWRLILAARDFDFMGLTLRTLTGEILDVVEGRDTQGAVYELMFQQAAPGTVFQSADFPRPDDAVYHEWRYNDGDVVGAINGRLEVVGYYVRLSPDWTHRRADVMAKGA
ncbi:ATP-grasp domain-containing protein [Shinella sp. M31]|uniref:ATP-grasp domain-containing protein n=1 Tax=Shinella sp. M31 TaxID=3368615 RepID=UPI003BA28CD4